MPNRQVQPMASSNVYVASLPPTFTDTLLYDLMAPYGRIVSARVMCDPRTGNCKGYGFVLFESEREAGAAINSLVGHTIEGHRIQVRFAHLAASPQFHKPDMPEIPGPQVIMPAPQPWAQTTFIQATQQAPQATANTAPMPMPIFLTGHSLAMGGTAPQHMFLAPQVMNAPHPQQSFIMQGGQSGSQPIFVLQGSTDFFGQTSNGFPNRVGPTHGGMQQLSSEHLAMLPISLGNIM